MRAHRQVSRALVGAVAVLAVGLLLAACSSSSSSGGSYTLNGKQTTLMFGPVQVVQLTAQGVSATAVAPAAMDPSGGINFPISGGSIDKKTLNGTIQHKGGVTFAANGKTMTMTDPVIDTTAGLLSATIDGKLTTVLQLAPLSAGLSTANKTVTITGTAATLFSGFSALVSQQLGVSGFAPSTHIGSVVVVATFSSS
jgi:hypothetical protein